jgi:hypothetical protein
MKKLNTFFIGLIVLVITSLSLFGFYQKWLIVSYEKTDFKQSNFKPNF